MFLTPEVLGCRVVDEHMLSSLEGGGTKLICCSAGGHESALQVRKVPCPSLEGSVKGLEIGLVNLLQIHPCFLFPSSV